MWKIGKKLTTSIIVNFLATHFDMLMNFPLHIWHIDDFVDTVEVEDMETEDIGDNTINLIEI